MRHLSCTIPEREDKLDLDRYNLTERQKEVAKLLSEGLNISEIVREMRISRVAVGKHKELILKKIKKVKNIA